jgi:hypothetical protein
MEGKRGYEKHWKTATGAERLRPAAKDEVEAWLNDEAHRDDMAENGYIDGRAMRAVTQNGETRFEPI